MAFFVFLSKVLTLSWVRYVKLVVPFTEYKTLFAYSVEIQNAFILLEHDH